MTLVRALGLALLLLLVPAAEVRASCAAPPPGYVPPPPRVVLDAVALSGDETAEGWLGSPVRLAVLAYRKGTGPRVVRVRSAHQVFLGRLLGWTTAFPGFRAGDVVRLRLDQTPRGLLSVGTCDDSVRPGPRRLLRRVAATAAGPSRAEARAGARAVRCLRLDGRSRCTIGRHAVLAQRVRGGETAVAAWARGLRRMEVSVGGGPPLVATASATRPALVRLRREYQPYDVRVRLVHADGFTQVRRGDALDRTFAADPSSPTRWTAFSRRSGRGACAVADHLVAPSAPRLVTCRRQTGRGFFAVHGPDAHAPRVVVYGIAAPVVTQLTLISPSGEQPLAPARRGGAFLAVLPEATDVSGLSLRANYADGSTATFAGARSGSF